MYLIETFNKKVKKRLEDYISIHPSIKDKLVRLKENLRKENNAHPLQGKLKGKWSCWLGSNIRMIYMIDEKRKMIIIEAIGTHKIY